MKTDPIHRQLGRAEARAFEAIGTYMPPVAGRHRCSPYGCDRCAEAATRAIAAIESAGLRIIVAAEHDEQRESVYRLLGVVESVYPAYSDEFVTDRGGISCVCCHAGAERSGTVDAPLRCPHAPDCGVARVQKAFGFADPPEAGTVYALGRVSRPRMLAAHARAVLREYPDADLSAFDIDGDVETMAAEETAKSIAALEAKASPPACRCLCHAFGYPHLVPSEPCCEAARIAATDTRTDTDKTATRESP